MLMTAASLMFGLPVLIAPPPRRDEPDPPSVGFLGAYRRLWLDTVGEWRRDRNVVYYLLASAVFRDGLSGVFAFGAVLGVNVYGISHADVLLFGITACVIAAVGAVLGGLLDDHVGSKPVIIGSLASMIAVGLTLMSLSGALAFLGVRADAVPVHRADPVGCPHFAAEDDRRRQGGGGVRPPHDHGPCGGVPRAMAVLHVHRPLRSRPRREGGLLVVLAAGLPACCWSAHPVASRLRRCRSSAPSRCADGPAHRRQ